MLRITVELLHGTFRGAGPDDAALTGHEVDAEWPPSPARLYQALVAGGRTGPRSTTPTGVAGLSLLESGPPRIFASGPSEVEQSNLLPRYAVIDEKAEGAVQNYPGRKAQAVRPGTRVAPADQRIVYEWPDVTPTQREVEGLRHRAARVSYLGCADSPVRLRVETAGPQLTLPGWIPDSTGSVTLPVPYPGWLEVLDAAFDEWTAGSPRRRSWLPTRFATYRPPGGSLHRMPGQAAWFRLSRPIQARWLVPLAEAMKAAVLDRYTTLFAGGDREQVPAVLHGHQPEGARGFHLVHWLPLPHAGFAHADGRIRGICVWVPDECDAETRAQIIAAAGSVRRLHRPGLFDVAVAPRQRSDDLVTVNPWRWSRPARRWVSVFPVVHERRLKHGLTLEEISRWCSHVGLPPPVWTRALDVPLVPGAAHLRPYDVFRAHAERRPYSHVELLFEEPIQGPVALGRARQYGLGLLAPVDAAESSGA